MSRAVFIKGKNVDLVALTAADAPLVHRWNCDLELIYCWGNPPFPVDLKGVQERLETQYKQKDSLMLGIQLRDGEELIGLGGLASIEWPWQRAELTIGIGDARHRGQGHGREAIMLILEHAFTKLNLHSVMLRVIAYNTAAIKCYEACGFKLSGRRREARLDGGTFYDVLFMDLLASEFKPLAGPLTTA